LEFTVQLSLTIIKINSPSLNKGVREFGATAKEAARAAWLQFDTYARPEEIISVRIKVIDSQPELSAPTAHQSPCQQKIAGIAKM
jgi:hypothetical protein